MTEPETYPKQDPERQKNKYKRKKYEIIYTEYILERSNLNNQSSRQK